mmetsp:Transcript_4036/g.8162  ORF Transcript_4036/g.8162 Transcript_4036/m.8162 type:complete len:89 (-) Transcript_4036:566-832(-)
MPKLPPHVVRVCLLHWLSSMHAQGICLANYFPLIVSSYHLLLMATPYWDDTVVQKDAHTHGVVGVAPVFKELTPMDRYWRMVILRLTS